MQHVLSQTVICVCVLSHMTHSFNVHVSNFVDVPVLESMHIKYETPTTSIKHVIVNFLSLLGYKMKYMIKNEIIFIET